MSTAWGSFTATPYTPPPTLDDTGQVAGAAGQPNITSAAATYDSAHNVWVCAFGPPDANRVWRINRVTIGGSTTQRVGFYVNNLSSYPAYIVDAVQYLEKPDLIGYFLPSGQTFYVSFNPGNSDCWTRIEYVELSA